MVITVSHTYNLGDLQAGEYLFTFKAWRFPVKNTTFTVMIVVVGGLEIPTNTPTGKPELQIPWMWLSTMLLSLAVAVLYGKFKKLKHHLLKIKNL